MHGQALCYGCFVRLASGDGHGQFVERSGFCMDFHALHFQKDQCGSKTGSFVAIDKRMILDKMKQIRCCDAKGD